MILLKILSPEYIIITLYFGERICLRSNQLSPLLLMDTEFLEELSLRHPKILFGFDEEGCLPPTLNNHEVGLKLKSENRITCM